jgi:cysteine desulfurase/selenocysteine lyase
VAVRSGQHCAQPVMDRFGVPATIRASFGIYNNMGDVDALVAALDKTRRMFG